jgi:hypothetical protein
MFNDDYDYYYDDNYFKGIFEPIVHLYVDKIDQ